MKTNLLTLAVVFTLLLVASCVKDDLPKPPYPPVVTYTVNIKCTGKGITNPEKSLTLVSGYSGKVIATPEQDYVLYSATLSGVGSLPLEKREGDVSLNISGLNSNSELEVVFLNKNLYTLIKSSNPYHLDSMNVYNEAGKMIASIGLAEEMKSAEMFFLYPEMNQKTIGKNGSISFIPFSLSGNSITIGSAVYTITKNDDKHFSMRTPYRILGGVYNFPTATEYVYSRQ